MSARLHAWRHQTVGLDCSEVVMASAKSGIGIEDILEQIVAKVPPPVRRLSD